MKYLFYIIVLFLFSINSYSINDNDLKIKNSLEKNISKVDFIDFDFKNALDYISDQSKINIHVDWKSLEASGITQSTKINIKLRDIKANSVLKLIITDAGQDKLDFYIENGVVEITTKEITDSKLYTIVYRVDDLVLPQMTNQIGMYTGQMYSNNTNTINRGNNQNNTRRNNSGNINNQQNNTYMNGYNNYNGYGMNGYNMNYNMNYGMNGYNNYNMGYNTGMNIGMNNPSQSAEQLKILICTSIYPDYWKMVYNQEDNKWEKNTNINAKSTMSYYDGKLIVTAPRSIHVMIGGDVGF